MEHFLDKNGTPILEGSVVEFTASVKVGEREYGRGRNKKYFDMCKNEKIIGVVRFGRWKDVLCGEIITYYIDTDHIAEYLTHSFSGLGSSRAERAKNELVRIKNNLSTRLTAKIASDCEVLQELEG